jgi:hypothetical protein
MAFGFQSFTEDGTLQIDETTPCLQLRQKGQLTVASGTNTAHITANLTYSGGSTPLVALRVPPERQAYATMTGAKLSGGTWTFKIAMENWSGLQGTYIVDYYIFDRPNTRDSWGLAIYDASGNLTYSSAQQAMLVETRSPTYNSSRQGWVVDDSRTYALALCSGYGYREQEHEISNPSGPPTYYWTWEQNLTMGTNVLGGYRIDLISTNGGDGFAPAYSDYEMYGDFAEGSANFLLVDVTGM